MTPLPDAVRDLHAVVRQWTAHVPQNLPYVDLMFAFAHATRGDRLRAAELVEAARRVMEVPIPEVRPDYQNFEATIAAVTTNFLFKVFHYRIDRALGGELHAVPFPAELLSDLEAITARARSGGANNSYLRAEYVIGRMREHSRIVEPLEQPDVYVMWTKDLDRFRRTLYELYTMRNPAELAARIRKLLADGVPGVRDRLIHFRVLCEVLPLAPRVGENFAAELLQVVPNLVAVSAIASHPGRVPPDLTRRQSEVLDRALFLAALYNRRDLAPPLVDALLELVQAKPEADRFRLVALVAGPCLQALKKLGLRADIDRVLKAVEGDILQGATVAELRVRYGAKPEAWAAALQTLLHLAAGWQMLGSPEKAAPVLDEARAALLDLTPLWHLRGRARNLQAKEYTELARAYVAALAEAPADVAFARLAGLFREMPRNRITNTWTTAQYYSRFHLVLVEEVVFAVCAAEPDAVHVVVG